MTAAARNRRRPQAGWAVSIALALCVVGFVGAMQWNSSVAREAFTTSAQQTLARQITTLEGEQNDLRSQIAAAEAEVQRVQAEQTSDSAANPREKATRDGRRRR